MVRSSESASNRATLAFPDPAMVTSALPRMEGASISPDPASTIAVRLGIVTRTVATPPILPISLARLMPKEPSSSEKRTASTAASSPDTAMFSFSPSVTITLSGPARTSSVGAAPLISNSASGTPSPSPMWMFMLSHPVTSAAPAKAASGARPFRIRWIIAVVFLSLRQSVLLI